MASASSKRTDWFRFHPADFLTSEVVQLLSPEEVGIYILMLAQAWGSRASLPNDPARVARLIHVDQSVLEAAMDGPLGDCWHVGEDGRLRNARLTSEWEYANKRSATASEAGSKGNRVRWGDRKAIASDSQQRSQSDRTAIAVDSQTDRTSIATQRENVEAEEELETEGVQGEGQSPANPGGSAPAADAAPRGEGGGSTKEQAPPGRGRRKVSKNAEVRKLMEPGAEFAWLAEDERHVALGEWLEYLDERLTRKRTSRGARAFLAKVASMSPELFEASVKHSMENEWQGLFEPKASGPRPSGNGGDDIFELVRSGRVTVRKEAQ